MDRGLYEVARGMQIRMKNMDMVANNLANVNTTGYKREVPFADYLSRMENQPVKQLSDLSDGSLVKTDDPLNLALSGNAYFMVQTEKGIELTRNGNFKITDDGNLVTNDGYKVLTYGGSVNLFEARMNRDDIHDLKIADNGEIYVNGNVIDKLMIARIDNQRFFERDAGGRFVREDQSYVLANEDEYKIHQGYLEESNVNALAEMQQMIKINRDFESAQKAIRSLDTMLSQAKEIGKI
jgi:flagellar basal-body rod protein FlgG